MATRIELPPTSDAIEAAELDGLTARRAGKGTSANPFDGDDPLFAVWVCGHQGLSVRALAPTPPESSPALLQRLADIDAGTVARETEEARALASGQAVYRRIAAGPQRPAGSVQPGVAITLDEWQDFRVWMQAYGMEPFGLPMSMTFMLGGVLVVVR